MSVYTSSCFNTKARLDEQLKLTSVGCSDCVAEADDFTGDADCDDDRLDSMGYDVGRTTS